MRPDLSAADLSAALRAIELYSRNTVPLRTLRSRISDFDYHPHLSSLKRSVHMSAAVRRVRRWTSVKPYLLDPAYIGY